MSGSGNDFVVIDNRESLIPDEVKKRFSKKICTPKTSVGADGVIFVENSEIKADFF